MKPPSRVLAVDPTTRGFGFAVFEGAGRLIDWGVADVRADKVAGCLKRVDELLRHYEPRMLVIEDSENSRRCVRVRDLLNKLRQHAVAHHLHVRTYSRGRIRNAFRREGVSTKSAIAEVIARRFPELYPRLPAPRKPWMTESESMSIFDAVALVVAHYYSSGALVPRPSSEELARTSHSDDMDVRRYV